MHHQRRQCDPDLRQRNVRLRLSEWARTLRRRLRAIDDRVQLRKLRPHVQRGCGYAALFELCGRWGHVHLRLWLLIGDADTLWHRVREHDEGCQSLRCMRHRVHDECFQRNGGVRFERMHVHVRLWVHAVRRRLCRYDHG